MSRDRLYIDSCYFIDAIKYRIGVAPDPDRLRDNQYIYDCLKAARAGEIEVVTSTLTLAEVRRAESTPDDNVKRLIRSVLTSGRIVTLAEVTQSVGEKARDLHWDYGINLSGADAIHVATAIITGCKEFLTLDVRKKSPHTYAAEIAGLGVRVIRAPNTRLLPPDYLQGSMLAPASDPNSPF
jgi:predicted nucleic acid-binding protein